MIRKHSSLTFLLFLPLCLMLGTLFGWSPARAALGNKLVAVGKAAFNLRATTLSSPMPPDTCLTETTQADFQTGTSSNLDLTTSPGDVSLTNTPVIDQQNTAGTTTGTGLGTPNWTGQTFIPAITGTLVKADIQLFCSGCGATPPNLTLSVRNTSGGLPTGADLASTTVPGSTFASGASTSYTATFGSPATLTAGTQYALILRPVSAPAGSGYFWIRSSPSTYANGSRVLSADSGATWSADTTRDYNFKTYIQTGYAASGELVSSSKDANPAPGTMTHWTLSWNATTPANTSLKFQAAASNNVGGPFNFVGPDGTASTFFTSSGASLSQFNGLRYLKYKALLSTTDNTATPTLSDVTICYNNVNTNPTITAGNALTRQQGAGASSATIATVSDSETAAGSLTVTATTVPTGITVNNIVNSNGTITADLSADCTAATGDNTVVLTVTDGGGLTATANLTVNVTSGAPTLGNYSNTSVTAGGNTTITPNAAPNGATSVVASTSTSFKGTLTINPTTGAVTVTNAQPAGSYSVTITASGSCSNTSQTFTLTVNNTSACSTASFADKTDFNVGSSPQYVTVGDFNGDGKQDLAVVNFASNNVTILLGNGSGGFSEAPGSPVSVGAGPYYASVGDFNGDGKQDLTVSNFSSNRVTILLGDGSGGFAQAPGSPVSAGTNADTVSVGDFNGDGKQDLAVANYGSNNVTILLGDGSGGFAQAPGSPITVGTNALDLVVGDFNNDGKQDLAVSNFGSDNVTILLGDGSGGFSEAPNSPIAVGDGPGFIVLGDFNGDGKQDLAMGNFNAPNATILLGDGHGGFSQAPGSPVSLGFKTYSVAVGDFNGDGKQDLAAADYNSDKVAILFGDGRGGFSVSSVSPFTMGSTPVNVAVGDFDGDGKQDIATSNSATNTISVRLGTCIAIATPTISASTNGTGTQDQSCPEQPLTLTANSLGATSFQWYRDIDLLPGETNSTLQATSAGTYYVTASANGFTTVPSAGYVVQNPTPHSPFISFRGQDSSVTSLEICQGSSSIIDSDSATGIQWYKDGVAIPGARSQSYTATQAGVYTAQLNALGCHSQFGRNVVVTVKAMPATPTITAGGPTTFCAGGSVTLTSSSASGNQWYLNGNPIGGATANTYNATASGNYTVVVTTNSCSSSASVATAVTVNPIPSTPTINAGGPTTFNSGDSVTLTSSSASGNQWYLNGSPIGGATNQTYIATVPGNYTVIVTTSNCSSAASAATTVTVNNPPTITAASPLTRTQGTAATSSTIATVSDDVTAAGSVTVAATTVPTGITVSNIVNSNGTITADVAASCGATVGTNTVVLTATDGAGLTATANLTVNVTANTAPTLGHYITTAVNVGASTTVTPDAAPTDNGTIASLTATAPGFTGSFGVNAAGVVSVSNAGPSGSYTVTVTATDDCGATSTATFTLNVNHLATTTTLASSLSPSIYGQSITLTATVSGNLHNTKLANVSFGTPSGTVRFFNGQTLLGTANLNTGTATLTTSVLTPNTYTLTAVYDGDSTFESSTSNNLTQVVNQSASTVALNSTNNPSASKQFVTLTAAVSVEVRGAFAPSGTITFREGANVLSTEPINSAGQAVLRTTTLAIGTHTITAEYSGDSNYQGQTSAALMQTVEKGITTTTLASSANPTSFGQAVTLTATVIGRSGTPTGIVQFYDGNQLLGMTPLNGQTATLTTDIIGEGTRTLTAIYMGDEQFSASTSAPLTQTMNLVCTYTLSTLTQSFTLAGGQGQVRVMGRAGCGWLASSSVPWITIVGGDEQGINGNGNGTVNLVVAPLTDGVSRTGTLTIAGQTVTITQAKPIAVVSGASFTGNEIAPGEIVSAFGADMSVGSEGATSLPLPTILAGTQVRIADSKGVARLAPLFYVSPLQINYQVPEDTALGAATITIINGSEEVTGAGTINIAAVAPGLFSINSNGQGLAAALVQRITADGTVTFEPIWQLDQAQGKFVSAPVNLGADTDLVFLVLFGTGVRNRSSLAIVTAYIGDQEVEVLYAGAQPDFTGLDQVNLCIPRSLSGIGDVEVTLTVDGKVVNTLRLNIQ